MAELWVVRHGQASLFAADYDVLSERGQAQARALGEHWAAAGVKVDAAFTGPAKRQGDTAALARTASGDRWPEATVVPGLDEHDAFGMLTKVVPKLADDPEIAALQDKLARATDNAGRSRGFQGLFEAVMARWLRSEIDAADAEPWPTFRARVLQALATLTSPRPGVRRTVAFSSVGPLAVLLQRALGTEDLASFRLGWRIRNASITRFVYSNTGSGGLRMTLDGFNCVPHLPDPTTWTFR